MKTVCDSLASEIVRCHTDDGCLEILQEEIYKAFYNTLKFQGNERKKFLVCDLFLNFL